MKAPIFLEAVLAIDIMYEEPQPNLEEKVNPQHLKRLFFLKKKTHPFSHQKHQFILSVKRN